MNLPSPRIGKFLAGIVCLIVLGVGWSFMTDWYWRAHPDTAFRIITGRRLPAGVHATAYGNEMTDNLFHTSHYWLLAGSPSALRRVTDGTGFVESEDALSIEPDLQQLFGVSGVSTRVVAGYEWELDYDRWYCIFEGRTTAFYSH